MKVEAFRLSNFKGIREASIHPGPHLVVVGGTNGSGKSSLVEGLWFTLAGNQACPDVPIRVGADKAEGSVDVGDYRVTRRVHASGNTKLHVVNRNGDVQAKPQSVLNGLFSTVAFDPLAFVRSDPVEQAATLKNLAGLGELFAEIDEAICEAAAVRKDVNRAVRSQEVELAAYGPDSEYENVPDEEVRVGVLAAEYEEAVRKRNDNDTVRRRALKERSRIEQAAKDREAAELRVADLKEALALAESRAQEAAFAEAEAKDKLAFTQDEVATLQDPDTTEIARRMRQAEGTNRAVRQKLERKAAYERWLGNRNHAIDLTSKIEALRKRKADALESTRFPVEGLSLSDDSVTFKGLPLAQVNSAEQIRVGLAVGAALKKPLRVGFIREGSLLDEDSLKAVEAWCVENDYQVFLEVVGRDTGDLVIEDGRVVGGGMAAPDRSFDDTFRQAADTF